MKIWRRHHPRLLDLPDLIHLIHGMTTRCFHLFLSVDVAFASLQVLSIFFNSISSPLLHVCFGLLLFRCSCVFQSRACLVFFLFKVCTIYFHFLDLIWSSVGCFYGPILEIFIIYHHRLRTTKCRPFLGANKGIFIVPHLLWHGISLLRSHPKDPVCCLVRQARDTEDLLQTYRIRV